MILGQRTIKTAIGTGVSIAFAEWLDLSFYASAGILTLLCIKGTRRQSYTSAWARFLACMLGLFFSGLLFEIFGYTPWMVTAVLLILIPINLALKTGEGIVTSTVIIFHVYSLKQVSISVIGNEFVLIMVGIGLALIVNLYMPNMDLKLQRYQENIELRFHWILMGLSNNLRQHSPEWDGKEIIETAEMLEMARNTALHDYENRHAGGTGYIRYFEMRERQLDILKNIMRRIHYITGEYVQTIAISDFLQRLSRAVQPGDTTKMHLDELAEIRKGFKKSSLPKTREEFESRAALMYISLEIQSYLQIKHDFLMRRTMR